MRPYRLYDADTAVAIFRETGKTIAIVFAGVSLLTGGMILGFHTEEPFLADLAGACEDAKYLHSCEYPPLFDWLAGLIGLVVMGVYCAVLLPFRRAPPPTIYCERCDGAGWVRDLEPNDGRCPRCLYDRFTYFAPLVPTGAVMYRTVVEPQMTGRALIERYRSQGWRDRLWHVWH